MKGLKDLPGVFGWNSRAGVTDLEQNLAILRRYRSDGDGAIGPANRAARESCAFRRGYNNQSFPEWTPSWPAFLPSAAFWWLDYYREFADVLNTRYERVWSDADCVIIRLSAKRAVAATPKRLRGVVAPPTSVARGNGHSKAVENGRGGVR